MRVEAGGVVAGRYRLARRLGEGGAGTSWLAQDLLLERDVTLKVLRSADAAVVAGFRREFSTLCGLVHPRLCRVEDFGALPSPSGTHLFYTAAFVEGVTLATFARGRAWTDVRGALVDALEALAFLHQLGIRHGDFKPENVIVSDDGRGTLIDLGCCHPLDAPPTETSGTPAYLAPEVLAGRPDVRSDLYAVGVALRTIGAALAEPLPAAVARLAERLTRAQPSARPNDTAEVLEALGGKSVLPRIPPTASGVLVERGRELAACRNLIDSLRTGTPGPRVLYIHGHEGVGRTRLLQEMKWMAQQAIAVVEGLSTGTSAVQSMLTRAIGSDTPIRGARSVLAARDALSEKADPVLLCLDDVQLLAPSERVLFDALVRSAGPNDAVGVIAASIAAPTITSLAITPVVLAPLSQAALREWLGPDISEAKLRALLDRTGGMPSEVAALLGDGARDEPRAVRADRRFKTLPELADEERTLLAVVVASHGRLAPSELDDFDVTGVTRLLADGWVRRDHEGLRLVRSSDAKRLEAALDRGVMTSARRLVAARLRERVRATEPDDPRHVRALGHLCEQLAWIGEVAEASELLVEATERPAHHAHAFVAAADRLVEVSPLPRTMLAAAAIHLAAGSPRRALAIAARVLRRATPADAGAVRLLAGSAYAALRDTHRAIRQLRRAIEMLDDAERAKAASQLSLALSRKGDYAEALVVAETALVGSHEAGVETDLRCDAAIAAAYLGDLARARTHVDGAIRSSKPSADPRLRIRVSSASALVEYRAGHAATAAGAYQRVREIADEAGLDDHSVSAALNHGAACHQAGDWGRALRAYEDGLRMATALGMLGSEATLLFDLAKIHVDLGQLERAERLAERAVEVAHEAGLAFIHAAALSVLGEVSLARGAHEAARRWLTEARVAFLAEGAIREVLEVDLQLGQVELRAGDGATTDRLLDATEAALEELGAGDLLARHRLLRAEVKLARGEHSEARALLEDAARRAEAADQRLLLADIEQRSSEACAREGSAFLASRHHDRAREHYERLAASLPAALRDTFLQARARVATPPRSAPSPAGIDRAADGLRRLLHINRRLNSALTGDEVLAAAMDAAIELTGAERGFLILRGERDKLRVPVARNLDREHIGKSHLKFSRGVAEKVIATGEPVVTTDAEADERFADNRSVHAMRLKSILCVPISSPDGVLGAIYLDNRFRPGGFDEADTELLLALADQVAIALERSRLHDELRVRTRELETERARVEELARGQAAEIERLGRELTARAAAPARRFEYEGIVGTSPAMERVFEVLDRVVGADITVLVRGESGTGKELVARALHDKGQRREGPFVAINCGALPDALLEAELFGYRRGAFTGATRDHPGLFVAARGGTLFLDELGEMSLEMQVKLLRVLQEREVRPLGSNDVVALDVRLVCATNRSLADEVQRGRFREDLYYRVAVVEIEMPPLRERSEDLLLLAPRILERVARELGRAAPRIDASALRRLLSHTWPGNVRELENVLSRALLLAEGGVIQERDLGLETERAGAEVGGRRGLRRGEAERMRATLDATGWNVVEAARALGIPRATFYRKLERYRLARPR